MVTKPSDSEKSSTAQTHSETENNLSTHSKTNGADSLETPTPSTPSSDLQGKNSERRRGEGGGKGEDEGGGTAPGHGSHANHHPNGWGNHIPPNNAPHISNNKQHLPHRGQGAARGTPGHPEGERRREQQENVVLRRGPGNRIVPEKVAQRKSSMFQLQQWVNERRGAASQEDINRWGGGVERDTRQRPAGWLCLKLVLKNRECIGSNIWSDHLGHSISGPHYHYIYIIITQYKYFH